MCVYYLYISTLSSDTEKTNNVCMCVYYLYISTLSSDTEKTNNVCGDMLFQDCLLLDIEVLRIRIMINPQQRTVVEYLEKISI